MLGKGGGECVLDLHTYQFVCACMHVYESVILCQHTSVYACMSFEEGIMVGTMVGVF